MEEELASVLSGEHAHHVRLAIPHDLYTALRDCSFDLIGQVKSSVCLP